MDAADIAKLLVDAPASERRSILGSNSQIDIAAIAAELHALCYEAWTEEPSRVSNVVDVFDALCEVSGSALVAAHAEWSRGIRSLVDGRLEECIDQLDTSREVFLTIADELAAAQTQTAKLYALALLGRYDEAVEVGLSAREVFLKHDDLYSTGKIEHNIGNLYWRRDLYREAEPYLASAHARFAAIDDQRQLAMVENCQAFVRTLQNDLAGAERLYREALARTERNNLTVTRAEIEIGLSNMYLFEGRYDAALRHLESARSAYDALGLEAQSVGCRLESADIYSEIGLFPEARDAYRAAAAYYEKAGIRAELARCLLGEARALTRTGDDDGVPILLERAAALYRQEGNDIGIGAVRLAQAESCRAAGNIVSAHAHAEQALNAFHRGGNKRLAFFARWFAADLDAIDNAERGIAALEDLLNDATDRSREVELLCHVSLGRLTHDVEHLTTAIRMTEGSRATLAADELRMAYLASRLAPYHEMVKLEVAAGRPHEAFSWHERSRARVLAEMLQRSEIVPASDEELQRLRQEISWFNNRINRTDIGAERGRSQVVGMQESLRDAERRYEERLRQLMVNQQVFVAESDLDLTSLAAQLGGATLVEYAFIDDRLAAFVITSNGIKVTRDLAARDELTAEVRHFLFQIKAGRTASRMSAPSRATALRRLSAYGQRLYQNLIEPLGIDSTHLVIVPAGILHQLPFGALNDGNRFLAERFVISYAPRALLLERLLAEPAAGRERALIVAVADERAPMIAREANAVAELLDTPLILEGQDATLDNLTRSARDADIVHLACHGRFRPDNPAFSSLHLAENITFRDLRTLRLKRSIIVLSACESGLNAVDAGGDLVGLTSAFFAAGAATLVMSLWRVDDAAALDLMTTFYSRLNTGRRPAEALADAQRASIAVGSHPYTWSQFIVSGRG